MSDQLTLQTADALELNLEIAGLGGRSYAYIIDWHIRLILAMAWLFGTALLFAGTDLDILFDSLQEDGGQVGFVYLVLMPALALYVLYHPVLEILLHGRTPGKRMAGIRIVTNRGQTPDVGALLVRNVFRLIDSLPAFYGVGITTVLLTKQQVRLGDLAAGTVLVYEEKITPVTLEKSAQLALTNTLDPRDQEFLLDLLERWRGLDRSTRIALGLRFIEQIGAEKPGDLPQRQLDRALHRHLQKLAGANR